MNKFLLFICFTTLGTYSHAQLWSEVNTDFPVISTGISRFDIVDENIAWGIGYNGIDPSVNIQQFSKIIDGGASWNAGSIAIGNTNLGIGDIAAIDDQIAFITVYPRSTGQQGGIWITEDGGGLWTKISQTAFNSSSSFINTIHFFDLNKAVVTGDPVGNVWEIYTTSDAGMSFNQVSGSNIPAPLAGETGYLAQKATAGNSIWFTTSAGRIFHSTDLGSSWNVYQSPISDFGGATISGDISFADDTKGILQTQAGVVYRTTNSGQTWSQITTSGTGNPYGDNIAYIPSSRAVVSVGSNPSFSGSSYSQDDGVTWVNIDTEQHVDVAFFNATTGYSGGFTSSSDDTGVFVFSSSVLSVDNSAFAKAISLYPNPTNNQVNINTTNSILQVELINLSGQNFKVFTPASSISLEGLPTGLYLLKIITNKGVQTIPIIKK